jgi:hypothetical protein
MIFSRWVENTIYSMFYEYDLQGYTEQMKKLKSICMNKINSHEGLREELTDEKKLRYFITQMMMESIK